ncbi:MAG: flagellin [Betaproteobacteria bacterium]|nr:flagellin [Betaproteobacteria bacterium]
MPQVINTNISSLNAQRNLNTSQSSLATALQRLSSGLRINSAKDDSAGLAISERMTAQVRGLDQAVRNANDGISLAQTTEGALVETTNALQRIRELAVQSANDTNSASDRSALQAEVAQLQQEINRIATTTQFNGKNLLDGTFAGQNFQVGANANQTIGISVANAKATSIGANIVSETGTMNAAVAANVSKQVNTVLGTEELTISGSTGTYTTTTVSAGDSAFALAALVNSNTASTNVSAQAITKAQLSGLSASGTVSFNLYGSNTAAVAISASIGATTDLTALNDAINNYAASTGISSTVNGGTLTLTSDQGYDINIENFLHSAGGAGSTITFRGLDGFTSATTTAGAAVSLIGSGTGADSSVVGGTMRFSSSGSFSVTDAAAGGMFSAATSNASSLSAVSSISVGSQTGANSAIDVIDAALQTINSQRAALGAMQNRFTSAVANLQTTSENISAARSRIRDADFASETASLTRAQILQQAGVAMLAQANAMPNSVLSLLK